MNKNITDGMAKEGKPFKNMMLFGYILAVLMPLIICLVNDRKYYNEKIIAIVISYFLIGSMGLYCWLYAIKYKLIITEEKIMLQTLFKKVNINIRDIKRYTCKRNRKTVFYQFSLYIKDKRIIVNTRYKEEFQEILRLNNIEQKSI